MILLADSECDCGIARSTHYENKPIQIYCIFYHQKMKILDKNFDVFHISAQK